MVQEAAAAQEIGSEIGALRIRSHSPAFGGAMSKMKALNRFLVNPYFSLAILRKYMMS